MKIAKHLLFGLTLGALALSGAAQAHSGGDGSRTHRDAVRVEGAAAKRLEHHRDRRADGRRDRGQDSRSDRFAHADRGGRDGHGRRHDNRIDARQERQRHRIHSGWHAGELNRGEVRQLKRQQHRIEKMERRFFADGHLSRYERRKLDQALDRSGRQIRRARHDDVYRADRFAYRHDHDRWRRHGH